MSVNKTQRSFDAFVNGIIRRTSENPIPKSDSDEQLAEEFTDYFLAKIRKICDSLETHPTYKPVHWDIDLLKEFQLQTEQEVSKIIGKWQANHAKLIQYPQHFLRRFYPV